MNRAKLTLSMTLTAKRPPPSFMHAGRSPTEFGENTDTYGTTYSSFYGCWRWQSHSDPAPRFALRDAWYAAHVAAQEVLPGV